MTTGALQPQIESVPSQGEEFTWIQVFYQAIRHPSVASFEKLLEDPQVSKKRVYLWVVFSTLAAVFISLVIESAANPAMNSLGGYVLILAPLAVLMALVALIIETGIWNAIAHRVGGKGSYLSMLYIAAAIQSPLVIIETLIRLIPNPGSLFSIPFLIYECALYIIAIKAVYKFGWGYAILVYFLPGLVLFGAALCIILAIAATRPG